MLNDSNPSLLEPALSASVAQDLLVRLRELAAAYGFADLRVSNAAIPGNAEALKRWLAAGYHGEMNYMARYGERRAQTAEMVSGSVRVISLRMNYLQSGAPQADAGAEQILSAATERLHQPEQAAISLYARGRDYHKVLCQRLAKLGADMAAIIPHNYRVFVDSAPIMEVAHATASGLGWRGKHTLLIERNAGSLFFLGEIVTDLPLPVDEPVAEHCGECRRCIDVCPTGAIVAPYQLDARRCISYLTIELRGSIPLEFRKLIGNRIYGCDDCQLFCPWNRFAQLSAVKDFQPRSALDEKTLLQLFAWTEAEFFEHTAGTPIYRIGYSCWLRNLAVALGNSPGTTEVIAALAARRNDENDMVREHVAWALAEHGQFHC